MTKRAVVHNQLAAGQQFNERVAARAVCALFGEAIFEALKAEGGCFERTETNAVVAAGRRGGAVGQGRGVVCAQPDGAAQLQDFGGGAGRPGGRAVLAFVRPTAVAGR